MKNMLHCIVKNEGAYWSARCLDFTLYVVGDTQEEAMAKLTGEIDEYLYEAIEGRDKAFAAQLLLRSAPWSDWAVFYIASVLQNYRSMTRLMGQTFQTAVPQGPYRHA